MEPIISLEETKEFINKYFKASRMRQSIIYIIFWIVTLGFLDRDSNFYLEFAIVIALALFNYFLGPKLLYKETEEETINLYEKIESISDNKEGSLIVCSLREGFGPTFGALYINKTQISFTPFKDNLQDKKIVINRNEIKEVDISIRDDKTSIINKLFSKDLSKLIKISYKNKEALLQVPKSDYVFEKLKQYFS